MAETIATRAAYGKALAEDGKYDEAIEQLATAKNLYGELDAAVPELENFAAQEGHHGAVLKGLLDRYGKNVDTTGKKVYVCGCCGFEYIGDLDAEPEDYVCPVCGQPKKVFKLKA